MSEPKRALRPVVDTTFDTAHDEATRGTTDRSANIIAFGVVAVVSMLFGFALGLLF